MGIGIHLHDAITEWKTRRQEADKPLASITELAEFAGRQAITEDQSTFDVTDPAASRALQDKINESEQD